MPLTDEARAYVPVLLCDPCSYCGETPKRIVIDHIVPVASGGTSEWDNLTAACASCNFSKGGKSLLRFLADRRQRRAQM